ncbi:hypothetical protein B0T22DRAFT_452970 [Podospora appendiculata]|uniref:Secreted protein n=1 Tax=Podospora appendiculata TaxID=314037 RepID=A0AAE0XJJ1_9PEZI|nr:hypothetical protein B0T22DRAFT_452970 [Podospora appendiculata]
MSSVLLLLLFLWAVAKLTSVSLSLSYCRPRVDAVSDGTSTSIRSAAYSFADDGETVVDDEASLALCVVCGE